MNAPAGRIIAERSVLDGSSLTSRERMVLRYIAGGFAEKEIAHRLKICRQTVAKHRMNLRTKAGAVSRRDLVLLARSLNLEPV